MNEDFQCPHCGEDIAVLYRTIVIRKRKLKESENTLKPSATEDTEHKEAIDDGDS